MVLWLIPFPFPIFVQQSAKRTVSAIKASAGIFSKNIKLEALQKVATDTARNFLVSDTGGGKALVQEIVTKTASSDKNAVMIPASSSFFKSKPNTSLFQSADNSPPPLLSFSSSLAILYTNYDNKITHPLPSVTHVALPADTFQHAGTIFPDLKSVAFQELDSLDYMCKLDGYLNAYWPFPYTLALSLPAWWMWWESHPLNLVLAVYSLFAVVVDCTAYANWRKKTDAQAFNLGLLLLLYGEPSIKAMILHGKYGKQEQ